MLYVGQSTDPEKNERETLDFCKVAGISLTFEKDKNDLYNWQQLYEPDIVFFAGYSSIIKTSHFNSVTHGIYNIHFGILPQFRGPAPVFWQLKKGLKEIGLTIHRMTDKLDSGNIIWQHKITNQAHFTYDFVNRLFFNLQTTGVLNIIETINKGTKPSEITQNEDQAAYYERPQLKDIFINWNEMSAEEILHLIKACNPWNSGATTLINGFELKILDATITITNKQLYKQGTVILKDNYNFAVACIENKLLNINYFKIDTNYIPARFAIAYGFKTGQCFTDYPVN